MMDDMESRIKEKLLQSLIEEMSKKDGERLMPHKGMEVEVAAPDKGKLAEGLDKAKGLLGDMPEKEMDEDESDDERLMQLMQDEEDEDKKGY